MKMTEKELKQYIENLRKEKEFQESKLLISNDYEICKMILDGITEKHTGKMYGLASFSTCCLLNEFCAMMHKNERCICKYCYANNQLKRYKKQAFKMARNTGLMSYKILNSDCMPYLNYKHFRLESFGELNNEIQAYNYLLLIEKNPQTFFGWFTKRPDIINKALRLLWQKDIPENVNIIYSNPLLNMDDEKRKRLFEKMKEKYPFISAQFNVYDVPAEKQNCPKQCINCMRCYTKIENPVEIIEKRK